MRLSLGVSEAEEKEGLKLVQNTSKEILMKRLQGREITEDLIDKMVQILGKYWSFGSLLTLQYSGWAFLGLLMDWVTKKSPLPRICHTYPAKMKLGSYTLPKGNLDDI